MQREFGLSIPETLDEVCDPARLALVVYDMQVGIVKQIENGQQITDKVVQVLAAARKAGIEKIPSVLLVVVRSSPVLWFLAVTAAPGTTAPF